MSSASGPANAGYGFCNWFLNNPATSDGPLPFPSAPRSAITFQGNGANLIYIDQENDLLMVVRWIDSNRNSDQFVGKVFAARQ